MFRSAESRALKHELDLAAATVGIVIGPFLNSVIEERDGFAFIQGAPFPMGGRQPTPHTRSQPNHNHFPVTRVRPREPNVVHGSSVRWNASVPSCAVAIAILPPHFQLRENLEQPDDLRTNHHA